MGERTKGWLSIAAEEVEFLKIKIEPPTEQVVLHRELRANVRERL